MSHLNVGGMLEKLYVLWSTLKFFMSHLNVGGMLEKLYVLHVQSNNIADKQYFFFILKYSRNIQYKHTLITTSKEIKINNSMNLQMLWLERFLESLVTQSQCNCLNPQEP